MDAKLLIAVLGVLGLTLVSFIFWSARTEKRLKKLFLGKKGKDLEEVVMSLREDLDKLKKDKEKIESDINLISVKLKKSIRGLETLRFNPFPDQGSNQSFAIGLMNEDGDGVILSSLYSRERMSVFAKPVKNKKSEYELSTEEEEVLKKAEVK